MVICGKISDSCSLLLDPSTAPSAHPYRGLIRVSCVINSIHDYRELLTSLLQITKEVMDCDAGSLFLYEEKTNDLSFHVALGEKADKLKEMGRLKMGQGVAGWVAQNHQSTLVADASNDPRFFRGADTKTGFQTRSMVCVPLLVNDKLVGVLQALNPLHKKSFDETDLEVFGAYGAMAATAIEKIRWQQSMLQQQKLEQELEIAQEIQSRFLSERFEKAEAILQLAIYNKAASQVGGDFYDVRETRDGRFAMILGDVTGKGVPAALLMAQILSEFRNHAPRESDPGKILACLNDSLSKRSARGMFATAWCAVVRTLNDSLETLQASAGHLAPLISSSAGARCVNLASGPPLGIMMGMDFPSTAAPIPRDHWLTIYTDGITEGRNLAGEEFGLDRMKRLAGSLGPDLTMARGAILRNIQEFSGGASQRDDVTFLLLAPRSVSHVAEPVGSSLHHECPSCPSQMAALRARVRESARAFGFDEETIGQLVLAVDEACTNIIRYAYEGRSDGKIEMDILAKNDVWEVRLRDYGKKCDPSRLQGRSLEDVRPGGLGLYFIHSAFDNVQFDQSPKEGTCLILKKKSWL